VTRIKICGINSAPAFDACVAAGIDWIGFVFYPPSPRHVTPAQAATLSARSPSGPLRVGLFVEPDAAQIAQALAAVKLDVLQLYADPSRVAALRAQFAVSVWRAVGVASSASLPASAEGADGFVVDAPALAGGLPGGNARRFDWSVLQSWQPPAPWLLAGGLDSENVREAIGMTGAPAVDVSSGVETGPGRKDPDLIRTFVARVRGHAR